MKVHQVIVYAASLMLLSSAVRGDVSAEAPLVDADDLASEVANIRSTPSKEEDFMPSSGRELDTDMEMDSMGEESMTPTLPRPSRRRTSWNSKPSWKKQHWNKQWGWKKDPWWKKEEWGWKKDPWWNKNAWGHNNWWDKPWKKPSWNDDYYWNKPSWGRGRKGPRKNKNLFHRRDQELNLWSSPSNDETDYDDEGGNY